MERKVFRSRISVLLIIIFLLVFSSCLIPMILSGNIFNPGFYIIVVVIAFIVFIFSGIRYVITDKQFLMNTWGTCKWSCSLSQIVSVERSYLFISSPAASLKRLKIRFRKESRFKRGYEFDSIWISPAREQEFLDALKSINPDIHIRVHNKKGWWRIWDWDI